jgi:crotonobetainyl-CoA:carnitine CoA-transferase CaiB-like acyl-CoA transferase
MVATEVLEADGAAVVTIEKTAGERRPQRNNEWQMEATWDRVHRGVLSSSWEKRAKAELAADHKQE